MQVAGVTCNELHLLYFSLTTQESLLVLVSMQAEQMGQALVQLTYVASH